MATDRISLTVTNDDGKVQEPVDNDTLEAHSALSEAEQEYDRQQESNEKLNVKEHNTFLEVDQGGSKTLSIFRCYTSPVYRRLFSSATSSALGGGESTADLGALEENSPSNKSSHTLGCGMSTHSLSVRKKTSGLGSVCEENEARDDSPGKAAETAKKSADAKLPKKDSKRKSKKDKNKLVPDLEPFGNFDKGFHLNPLNSGRRGSMEPPAPLDDIPLHPSPRNAEARKSSDGFHSANGSPAEGKKLAEVKDLKLDLHLSGGDTTRSQKTPKKVLVKEEHGGVPEEMCTTIMVRNIPNKYSQRMLEEVFVNFGFGGTFDFLYVPADFFHRLNLGYCFVNFKKPEYAQAFAKIMQDYHLPAFKSKKKIQISLANTQGFYPNVQKLEHTALCSQYVSPEFHPICVDPATGEERPFLSFFPGYQAPPKSRMEDPEYWAEHDANWQQQWEGETLYPPVFVNQTNQNGGKSQPTFSPAANKAGHGGSSQRNHGSHGHGGNTSHRNNSGGRYQNNHRGNNNRY